MPPGTTLPGVEPFKRNESEYKEYVSLFLSVFKGVWVEVWVSVFVFCWVSVWFCDAFCGAAVYVCVCLWIMRVVCVCDCVYTFVYICMFLHVHFHVFVFVHVKCKYMLMFNFSMCICVSEFVLVSCVVLGCAHHFFVQVNPLFRDQHFSFTGHFVASPATKIQPCRMNQKTHCLRVQMLAELSIGIL